MGSATVLSLIYLLGVVSAQVTPGTLTPATLKLKPAFGASLANIAFTDSTCNPAFWCFSSAYLSGYITGGLIGSGGVPQYVQIYGECRSTGIYWSQNTGSTANWDPTKNADYSTVTFTFASGVQNTACVSNSPAPGSSFYSCGAAKNSYVTKYAYPSTPFYTEAKCKAEDGLGSSYFSNYNPQLCQVLPFGGTTTQYGYVGGQCNAAIDSTKTVSYTCYTDDTCTTTMTCPTTTTTTTTTVTTTTTADLPNCYDVGEPVTTYRTPKNSGKCVATLHSSAPNGVCNQAGLSWIPLPKCGQGIPGAPNLNSAASIGVNAVVVVFAAIFAFVN